VADHLWVFSRVGFFSIVFNFRHLTWLSRAWDFELESDLLRTLRIPRYRWRLIAEVSFVLMALVSGLATTTTATEFSTNGGVFQEQGFQNTVQLGSYDQTQAVQAGGGFTYDSTTDVTGLTEHGQANSLADISGLHAHSFAQMDMSGSSTVFSDWTLGASNVVFSTYDDMVISGPAGTVTTSLNLFLHGSESATTSLPSIGTNNANENIQLSFLVNGTNIGGGSQSISSSNGGAPIVNSLGMLVGWQEFGGLITPKFTVPTNVPFSLEPFLNTFAEVTGDLRGSFDVSANADFGSTLTFAPSGPVFNLPQGYTANSAGAGIANNLLVPEPSSFFLAAIGLAMLFAIATSCIACRRRQVAHHPRTC
jgi:hypothetical protein